MDTREIISDIRENDKNLNSFIILDTEGLAGKNRASGGVLAGRRIAVKSNMCVEGLPATCASKTLENYIAPYDAAVVEAVKRNGGLIVGLANMDEFACGASGETSYFGPTQNPRAPGFIPGGSSSGSAAAVSAGLVDIALGSDTGGSIRNPASHCGVAGFKPTYGLVSRYGLIDMAMSLDQIGPLAKDVRDVALMMDVIAGHDHRDGVSLPVGKQDCQFSKNLNPELKGRRLGYAQEFDRLIADGGIRKTIHNAVDNLSSAGAEIVDISLPNLEKSLPTYYLNVYVEFYSATRKFDGRRYGLRIEDACGEEVLRRILLGSYISQKEYSGRYYRKALQARSVIRNELSFAMKDVDVIIGPTVPKLPHKIGTRIDDPMVMYAYDIFTTPVNLAGLPAGSVPAGTVDGIPTGLQVIGKPLGDQTVLDVMHGFQLLG
ncbi:MAG: Asp-tRNA(Asn)/Glu-tRNA(Gln) amidotransferase subunit GatA [Candidatus Altiarchaeota archaeon]|nr:Asp-tRNA(Asn)/Glu-tRNA(Gln) amidotransferase subunit GatA [Candidatus Altiarchaeota archaeon]